MMSCAAGLDCLFIKVDQGREEVDRGYSVDGSGVADGMKQ